MRKKIVAANWKMNLHKDEALSLYSDLENDLGSVGESVEVVVFPPSIYLSGILELNNSTIHVGAQNFYFEEKGAFTGEISAEQLKELGCSYVLVGHSERRILFGEKEDVLLKKIKAALRAGLNIIYCIGETIDEREKGEHKVKIQSQIELLSSFNESELSNISIAYEPIWAIGTGLTATPIQAEEIHDFIRSVLTELFGQSISFNLSLLYGGSCNEKNAVELFNCANIDGGLIGGASLKYDSFSKIVYSFE
jgi:triosephosphate isomerase